MTLAPLLMSPLATLAWKPGFGDGGVPPVNEMTILKSALVLAVIALLRALKLTVMTLPATPQPAPPLTIEPKVVLPRRRLILWIVAIATPGVGCSTVMSALTLVTV